MCGEEQLAPGELETIAIRQKLYEIFEVPI